MNDLYRQQGYVIIKQFFDIADIDAIRQQVKQAFSAVSDDFQSMDASLPELYDNNFQAYHGAAKLANHVTALHQLGTQPKLLDTLKEFGLKQPVIAARPLMWFHSPKVAKTARYARLPAHQEWSNMQGSLNAMVAWTPLAPVTKEMGRLQVIPGSHLRGLLPFVGNEAEDYPFSIPAKHIDEADFIEAEVELGDLLLFSAFLIHRSGDNQSNKIRWTCNFRFNDMTCPRFVARHYLNPFQFDVSTQLLDGYQPSAKELTNLFQS